LNGYIAGASSKSKGKKSEEEVAIKEEGKDESSKVTDDHAFAILDAFEVFDSECREVRLLKLRNPWGKFGQIGNVEIEWEGNWSENSPLWT